MARYGWEIYDSNGSLLTNDRRYNCFHLDTFQSNPGSYGSDRDSYARTFYGLSASEVRVIPGAGPLVSSGGNVSGGSGISINIYSSGGGTRVEITETRGNTTGSGSTFWIVTTRVDPGSEAAGDYGIALYDARGGIAFPPEIPPYEYIGKAEQVPGGESADTPFYQEKGYLAIETYGATPPLCFYRQTNGSYIPRNGSVRKSSIAPKHKNYRWALCVSPTAFGSLAETNTYLEGYCFEPNTQRNTSGYGLSIHNESKILDIANTDGLFIHKQARLLGDFSLNSNDLRIYTGTIKAAMTPLYSFVQFNNGIYDFNTIRWAPKDSYCHGDHLRYSGGYSQASRSADWYRDMLMAQNMISVVIDSSLY